MAGSRKDTIRVTLSVAGNDFGEWETKTGGKVSANSTMNRPGAMKPAESLGGVPTTDTITLSRNYKLQRDHDRIALLLNSVGLSATVREQPLDPDGNAYGSASVTTGILDGVARPDTDTNSSDSATYSVDISPNGVPTVI